MSYQSLDQFIADLPAHVAQHSDALKGHDTTVLFQTRQGRQIHITLASGGITITPQELPADCTVTADENDLLALINGKLSPAKAIFLGKIKLRGNIVQLMSLIALL